MHPLPVANTAPPLPRLLPALQTEDRPIVRERVEFIKEHRPVEKEFVVRQKG